MHDDQLTQWQLSIAESANCGLLFPQSSVPYELYIHIYSHVTPPRYGASQETRETICRRANLKRAKVRQTRIARGSSSVAPVCGTISEHLDSFYSFFVPLFVFKSDPSIQFRCGRKVVSLFGEFLFAVSCRLSFHVVFAASWILFGTRMGGGTVTVRFLFLCDIVISGFLQMCESTSS